MLCLIAFYSLNLFSQQEDNFSDTLKRKHSPTLASVMSAIVPGSGQVYNKKYWKVPIIYAGMGALVYFAIDNKKVYMKYRDAYIYKTDTDSLTIDPYPDFSASDVETEMNKWRRYRDMNVIFLSLIYVLNIIDASVDANLFDYDVTNDLTLRLDPILNKTPNGSHVGLKLRLKF
ncbi:MAG: hypothetical protein A2033_05500 [Bacteroidetes bacterium GWA2_31_9]|nr:MAG: hypothetical protein A2033_05500 [Bacteroidetes bacterium GWA2_31_9]